MDYICCKIILHKTNYSKKSDQVNIPIVMRFRACPTTLVNCKITIRRLKYAMEISDFGTHSDCDVAI